MSSMTKENVRSLASRGHELAQKKNQLQVLADSVDAVPHFNEKLKEHGIEPLQSREIEILQINVGYACNQTCDHCHVDAGPDRKEEMTKEAMLQCLNAVDAAGVKTVDITGGAPEMNPNFQWLVEELSQRNVEIIVRSNLTILVANKHYRTYPEFFKKHKIRVVASLPCYTEDNTDKQRGSGVFGKSIEALQILNDLGYGSDPELVLDLVYNPGGPFLAPDQDKLKVDYDERLWQDFGIKFNSLFALNNLPISRFLDYLLVIGKYEKYMDTLVNAFNPAAVSGVMCLNTVSVDWQGNLYDCDFNQILGLPVSKEASRHISEFEVARMKERKVVTHQHCYGCTAGAGSSCQGALA